MPERKTRKQAASAKKRGDKPSTQAGAFVGEEMRHKRSGKHPVKNKKQAIAIGLSKARQAGVKVAKKAKPKSRGAAKKKPASRSKKSSD